MIGDLDHDGALMMMPHHEGAIDLAEAELSYGKAPVMRRLAEEIIVDQQSERVSRSAHEDHKCQQKYRGRLREQRTLSPYAKARCVRVIWRRSCMIAA
jgi:hypothetical protein